MAKTFKIEQVDQNKFIKANNRINTIFFILVTPYKAIISKRSRNSPDYYRYS